ncbi:serine acetyltransferase [Candidatus Kaiserbacteria bacterium]|nr:MAG: serine acetyltransferase [Candidatus Kaiserbacteria bacterium]
MWFQFYFTPLTGVLFTFPSRYLFTIDLNEYLALPVSTGGFTRAIRVPSYSRILAKESRLFSSTGLLPSRVNLPRLFL